MSYARRILDSPWALVVMTAIFGVTLVRDTVDAAGTWPVLWRGTLATLAVASALFFAYGLLNTTEPPAD